MESNDNLSKVRGSKSNPKDKVNEWKVSKGKENAHNVNLNECSEEPESWLYKA